MPENKHPWYKHYPADWLLGTTGLTLEQQGLYQRLLDVEWREGSIPDEVELISNLTSTHLRVIRRLTPTLLQLKFQLTSTGWINKRLERERQVQVAYMDRMSEAGKEGASKRWGGHTKQIQRHIKRIDTDKEPSEIPKDEPNSQDTEVVEKMAEAVRKMNSNGFPNFDKKPALRTRWLNEARLLRTIDQRDPKTTLALIAGLSSGEFKGSGSFDWANQIKHPGKFRAENKAGETYWEVLNNERSQKDRSAGVVAPELSKFRHIRARERKRASSKEGG